MFRVILHVPHNVVDFFLKMFKILRRNFNSQYSKLSPIDKLNFVPPNPPTLQDFLSKINRDAATQVTQFKSIQELLTIKSNKMVGLKPRIKKYLLSCREWYKRTGEVPSAPMPKRQHKYLKRKEQVKLLRLKKLGLA